jgi:hypothetical protein
MSLRSNLAYHAKRKKEVHAMLRRLATETTPPATVEALRALRVDLSKPDGSPLSEHEILLANIYLAYYAMPPADGTCLCCRETLIPVWALQHGIARCRLCSYPYRAYHYDVAGIHRVSITSWRCIRAVSSRYETTEGRLRRSHGALFGPAVAPRSPLT